jgi:hypothetical protein
VKSLRATKRINAQQVPKTARTHAKKRTNHGWHEACNYRAKRAGVVFPAETTGKLNAAGYDIVSAGPDERMGSDDDIVNWPKK